MGEVKIKSGNLFDINGKYSAYMHQGSPTCRVDNGQIIVNVVPYYFAHIKFSALIPSGQYTVKCKASTNFRAMRLLLTKPFDTGTWNDSYQRYYADMIKSDNYYTYTFTVDEDFSIGFAISGVTGDTGVIEEIMLNEGSTALPFQPYFLNRPAHQYVNGEWIDIPTHKYTNNRWQGELTSQSPLEFKATGQSLLDWRIEGASGGVGDWDETAQKYKIPVTVNGVTTTLYTDHQLMDGDSIDYATTETQIPIATGNNTLTADTAVQPKSVFVKFEG